MATNVLYYWHITYFNKYIKTYYINTFKRHFHVSKNNSKSNKIITILVVDSSSLNMKMRLDNTSNNTR